MKTLIDKLDRDQQHVIQNEARALLVEGVVGSGKTDTLIAKILHLIHNKKVPGNKILVVAFNHGTIKEIQRRLRLYLPESSPDQRPCVYTFHEWSARLLRYELPIVEISLTPYFSVCDTTENSFFFQKREASGNERAKLEDILQKIDQLETNGEASQLRREYSYYNEVRGRAVIQRKMDTLFFDELLSYADQLSERNDFDAPDWIFVDEVQNISSEYMTLITRCFQKQSNIVFFGDFNQKVYPFFKSWGTTFKSLGDELRSLIMKRFSPSCLKLSKNYRSAPAIVDAANIFMLGNTKMTAHRSESGQKIVIKYHVQRNSLGNSIVHDIDYLRKSGIAYSDMAVLIKDKNDRRDVNVALDDAGIPVYGNRDTDGELKATLEWFVHLLLFSINQNDVYAKYQLSFPSVARLTHQMTNFRQWCDTVNGSQGIGGLLYQYFALDSQDIPTKANRSEQAEILRKFLADMETSLQESGEKTILCGIINYLTICRLDQEKLLGVIEQGHDSIRLLTLHSSSGLEFKYVWMYGNFDPYKKFGTKPYQYDEDEERLFFVGLTRASDCVTILPKYSTDFPSDRQFLSRIPKSLTQDSMVPVDKPSVLGPSDSITYLGKQCTHSKYGQGSVIGQNDQGLTIHYPNYRTGYSEIYPWDVIEFINWVI